MDTYGKAKRWTEAIATREVIMTLLFALLLLVVVGVLNV